MGMKRSDVIEAIKNISEERIQKLKIENWLELELGRIVNRKHYWWRKKNLTFNSAPGTPTYDLSQAGLAAADDFYKMIRLYRVESATDFSVIQWEGDPGNILKAAYATTQDTPCKYTIEPGTTKTVRLIAAPNATAQYVGMYYAGVNINWTDPSDDIPLLPPEHHYVVVAAMLRRAMWYLYGQKDQRYVTAIADEKDALIELDRYQAPSMEQSVEWRFTDSQEIVRSTR